MKDHLEFIQTNDIVEVNCSKCREVPVEANDVCETSIFEDDESIADMIQRNVMKGTETDMKRSGTKVSLSAEIHNDNIAQGEVVEDKHTGPKEPDRTSTPLVNIQPVDIVENRKNSKEVRDNQVDSQATIVKYYIYSDKDQKGQIDTKQQTVKKSHNESGLKLEINTVETSKNTRSNLEEMTGKLKKKKLENIWM